MVDYFEASTRPEEILFHWRERESAQANELRTARLVRDLTRSEIAMPLPQSASEFETLSTANFFLIGLEGTAQRHASMQPNLSSPPVEVGKTRSEERARKRRMVGLALWEQNHVDLMDEARALEFYAYARAPVMIRPQYRNVDGGRAGLAVWEPRDGLTAYPAPGMSGADVHPDDCIFAFQRSWRWVLQRYPDEAKFLYVGESKPDLDSMFDVVEYLDGEQHTMIVVGRDRTTAPRGRSVLGVYSGVGKTIIDPGLSGTAKYGSHEACVVQQARVMAGGMCPVIMPGRWSLDGRSGQFDGMIGLFMRLQRLSALEDDAIERGVFPEEWLVNPNGEAKVVVKADGRRGILGEITQGDIRTRDLNPGYRTSQAIDRLERMLKMEGHIPAEFGGENPSGVRTGVRGEALINAFISFNLASGQRVFQAAKARELEVAAATMRDCFGARKSRFFVSWAGAKGPVDFTPDDIFGESTRFVVRYPTIGADRNIQQSSDISKVGARLMSRETFMERDQDVEDVETELDRMTGERIDESVLMAFETQCAKGEITPVDAAKVRRLVKANKVDLSDAIEQVHREAQERQADQQAAAPDDVAAQPGLANAAPPPAAAPAPSLEQLLGQLGAGAAAAPAAPAAPVAA